MFSASGIELVVQGDVGGANPIKGLESTLTVPQLKVDRSQAEFQVEKLTYRAKGNQPDKSFEITFDAPHLALSPETATGEPVAGPITLSNKQKQTGLARGI